jgi:hypothetical protein
MTRDDIIRMAQEACKPDAPFRQYVGDVDCGLLMRDEHLERFAALVAAAEREACAKACDDIRYSGYCPPEDGVAPDYYNSAAAECADAIRARGNG